MRVSLEQSVCSWAHQYPRTVEAISAIYQAGGRVALCSSRAAQLAAEAVGQDAPRQPDDTDLLIHPADLPLAAKVLGVEVTRDRRMYVRGNGVLFIFDADEVIAPRDGTFVQLVCPREPLRSGDHVYRTTFTDLAAQASDVYKTEYGFVPVASTDSRFLYGVMQRNHSKNDFENAAALAPAAHGQEGAYSILRSEEMNLDQRVWRFLGQAGMELAQKSIAAV